MSPAERTLIYWVMIGGAYVILWWLSFFILLPIGLHNEDDPPGQFKLGELPKPKSERVPPSLSMGRKLLLATASATVLWAVFYGLVLAGVIRF